MESLPSVADEFFVARLMREEWAQGGLGRKRRFKRTTDSLHAFPIAPEPSGPGLRSGPAEPEVGLADISYVWTREGWLYLAVVIDRVARRVVGWATSDPAPQGTGIVGSAPGHRRAAASCRRPHFTTRTAAANTAPSITRLGAEEERHRDFDVRKGKLLR